MKKLFSLVLCLALVLGVIGSSLAVVPMYYSGNHTSGLQFWTYVPDVSTTKNWSLSFSYSNLTPTNRAVVRIVDLSGNAASSTWVYQNNSNKVHPYKKLFRIGERVFLKGRMDNRDHGYILVNGYFHP